MKKPSMRGAAAAIACAAVAASMCAAVPALAATVSPGTDGAPNPSTVDTLLYTDTDGNGDGTADTVNGTWFVTIPDAVPLAKAGNDGAPGTYAGTADITYRGQIGTKQKLSVTPPATVTMTDSKGWSSPVTVTATPTGLSDLDYAAVYGGGKGGSGKTAFTGEFGAGSWTGTCTFAISLK